MKVVIVSSARRFATRAAELMIFRDNVQHHLQQGEPRSNYGRIHELADGVVGFGASCPPACELWAECSLAFAAIRDIGVRDLAMSLRTRAALTAEHVVLPVRGTVLVRRSGWSPGFPLKGFNTLGDVFRDVFSGIEYVTFSGRLSGAVRVFTEIPAPTPARVKR